MTAKATAFEPSGRPLRLPDWSSAGGPCLCGAPEPEVARAEEIPGLAAKRPAELAESAESDVLIAALEPVQCRLADPEGPCHADLGEPCLSPQPSQ